MKLFFLYCFVLSLSGMSLYFVKLSIDEKHNHLKQIHKQISVQENRNKLLVTELEYLTRPERILNISKNYLGMQFISPDRILHLQSIPMRRRNLNQKIKFNNNDKIKN